jgi:hypothetical protein
MYQLKVTEEFLTLDEDQAEGLVQAAKEAGPTKGYEVVGYSTSKKTKKASEYYIVKIIKEFNKEKDLIVE